MEDKDKQMKKGSERAQTCKRLYVQLKEIKCDFSAEMKWESSSCWTREKKRLTDKQSQKEGKMEVKAVIVRDNSS